MAFPLELRAGRKLWPEAEQMEVGILGRGGWRRGSLATWLGTGDKSSQPPCYVTHLFFGKQQGLVGLWGGSPRTGVSPSPNKVGTLPRCPPRAWAMRHSRIPGKMLQIPPEECFTTWESQSPSQNSLSVICFYSQFHLKFSLFFGTSDYITAKNTFCVALPSSFDNLLSINRTAQF